MTIDQHDSAPASRMQDVQHEIGDHSYRLIPLTQGRFAVVDAADYELLAGHKWHATRSGGTYYAVRMVGRRKVGMHRVITDCPPGLCCDHINHDGLDNRRCNLRVCTNAQNQYNQQPSCRGSSLYKGVCWHTRNRKWMAQIMHNRVNIHLGHFDYEADAALAYDEKAIELFGEFACLNFNYHPQIRQWLRESYLFSPVQLPASIATAGSRP